MKSVDKIARLLCGGIIFLFTLTLLWCVASCAREENMQHHLKVDPELTEYIKRPKAHVIILAVQDRQNEVLKIINKFGGKVYEYLGFVNGYFSEIPGSKISELAKSDDVLYISHSGPAKPHNPKNRFYVNVIKGLEWVVSNMGRTHTKVANLSLGPENPKPFDDRDPINLATKIGYQKGLVVVVAAGNWGPDENTLNPWAVAPWVISVGAASDDGKRLYERSSRGKHSDSLYKPSIVAPGIDIVGPWPSYSRRSPSRLEKDRKFIPKDKLDRYTVMSGTSMAAAHISHLILWLIQFIEELRDDLNDIELQKFERIAPRRPFAVANLDTGIDPNHEAFKNWYPAPPRVRTLERKVKIGELLKFLRSNNITWSVEPSPDIIKKMLTDMAEPMSEYESHQVGNGFVSQEVAKQYLKDFRIVNFYKLFCEQTIHKSVEPLLQKFDQQVGPLATNEEVEEIVTISRVSVEVVVVKVW